MSLNASPSSINFDAASEGGRIVAGPGEMEQELCYPQSHHLLAPAVMENRVNDLSPAYPPLEFTREETGSGT